jgi:hypothetical protein
VVRREVLMRCGCAHKCLTQEIDFPPRSTLGRNGAKRQYMAESDSSPASKGN